MDATSTQGGGSGAQARTAGQAAPSEFSAQSAQHMTHMANPANPGDPYERCAIQFQLPAAIIWQIKFVLSSVQSKKSQSTASAEFANVSADSISNMHYLTSYIFLVYSSRKGSAKILTSIFSRS